MNSVQDPYGRSIPYKESNFEIGFLSSILHTFILIFFAELGDKTFIMLFILQIRTNKVTIFYSALFAEILMNSLACVFGYLINYLLYKNLIDYLGIMFFIIYGIVLVLWGFTKENETFEAELEIVEELNRQKMKRTSSMILGVDEDDKNENEEKFDDKYNLEGVNIINEKQYVPNIKKELTIIPESDISREDSVMSDAGTILIPGKKIKNNDDNDSNDFILTSKNSGSNQFSLKLRKLNRKNTNDKKLNKDKNTEENNINNMSVNDSVNNDENITYEEINDNENNFNDRKKLRYKSRYYLDYFDKNVDTEKPNIDTSIFGTIFFSICLSEFGDRTQLISFASSSIFHFFGGLIGSCTALFCTCLLGVYFSKPIIKNLKQKIIYFALGTLFLAYGLQIYYFKLKYEYTI
jgi:putative Ca2+/H+ antiporter (TMEM165/GDT1 family)